MKTNILSILSFVLFGSLSWAGGKGPPVVSDLDLIRYQGLWHQLAAIPAPFQKDCVANTRAEYRLVEDNQVEVTNSCEEKNGERNEAHGRARTNPKFDESAKLQVTFVKLFGRWIWLFGGDYWVMDIDEDYEVALIGEPGFKYAWVLSRHETLTASEYMEIQQRLQTLGYDPCKFILSNTPQQKFEMEMSLCDLSYE